MTIIIILVNNLHHVEEPKLKKVSSLIMSCPRNLVLLLLLDLFGLLFLPQLQIKVTHIIFMFK